MLFVILVSVLCRLEMLKRGGFCSAPCCECWLGITASSGISCLHCKQRREGWRRPSQVWWGLCWYPHSSSSIPSVQIAPFLKQVTVVSGSGVGAAHSPEPNCAGLVCACTHAWFPWQRKWAGWVQVAWEALTPATSSISLTCCPFWHLIVRSIFQYWDTKSYLTFSSPAPLLSEEELAVLQ